MKKSKLYALSLAMTIVLGACSHSAAEKKVDSEASRETAVKSSADLDKEAKQLIRTTPGLTDDQRAQLSSLRETTVTKLNGLKANSLQLRSLLIKNIVSEKYDENEVNAIKKRLKDVENQRLTATFNAVESANKILGHDPNAEHQRIMNDFFETHEVMD